MAETSAPVGNSIIDTSLLLCQCIEEWQQREHEELRDGKLDWDGIAATMSSRTGKAVVKGDLQTVWKFIAYGKHFVRPDHEESITYSDDEDPFYQPFTAVKRNKIYLTASSKEKPPLSERNYLPSTVPNVLNTKIIGKSMKVDIPQHIMRSNCGLNPPLYVSSSDLISINRMTVLNPRAGMLSAQNNTPFVQELKKVEQRAIASPDVNKFSTPAQALVNAPSSAQLTNGAVSAVKLVGYAAGGYGRSVVSSLPTAARPVAAGNPAAGAAAVAAYKRNLSATASMPAKKKQTIIPLRSTNSAPFVTGQSNTSAPSSLLTSVTVPALAAAVHPVPISQTVAPQFGSLLAVGNVMSVPVIVDGNDTAGDGADTVVNLTANSIPPN